MRALWMLAGAMLLPPTATAAYQMTLESTEPAGPEMDAAVRVTVTGACEDVALDMDPVTQKVWIPIDVQAPSTLRLTGVGDVGVPLRPCTDPAQRASSGSIEVQVHILPEAAGLVPITVEVTASTPPRQGLSPEPGPEGSFVVTPGYVSRLEAKAEKESFAVKEGPKPFAVDVTNLGNAPTRVVVAADCSRGRLELPPGFVVDTNGSEAVLMEYRPPSGRWVEANCTLALFPGYAFNSDLKGTPVEVAVSFRQAGLGRYVPGPGLGLALPALGLVAARRHDRPSTRPSRKPKLADAG